MFGGQLPPYATSSWKSTGDRSGFDGVGGFVRKILVSVNVLPAILGPEMAARILWAPGKIAVFLQEKLHAYKIPRFRGGVYFGFFRGESRFYFHGREDFSDFGCWDSSAFEAIPLSLSPRTLTWLWAAAHKVLEIHMSGGANDYQNSYRSRFQACISFLRRFREPAAPIRKILVYTGMLPCLVPS